MRTVKTKRGRSTRRGAAPGTQGSGSQRSQGSQEKTAARSAPLLYTAQDVAHFCEVDLKTIHHWADAGKVPHHRTEGRHLRFRRNHIVQFLRAHGYPLPAELVTARPTIFLALPSKMTTTATAATNDEHDEHDGDGAQIDDVVKKLASRFHVQRFESSISAITRLVAAQPDALVLSTEDDTWPGAPAVRALKTDPATSWILLIVMTAASSVDAPAIEVPTVDLVLTTSELLRLHAELVKHLDVD